MVRQFKGIASLLFFHIKSAPNFPEKGNSKNTAKILLKSADCPKN